ncbi:MAG: class C sortase [Rothia mucilaginosa]|uniref:Class C sortase n=1 Tax=Rothia mucilaginosa TaxID=43675 RepID=A0A930LU66_9MICC|nr:class C sortase [Rothia mucilaginosa]
MKAATMRRFAAALMLAVALMLAYPTVGTIWENQQAREAAAQQTQQAETLKQQQPEKVVQALLDAHAYNQSLTGIALVDPYSATSSEHDTAAWDNYLHQLADTDVMGRIRVPDVGIDLPIHHGTSDEAMRTGAGHLYGTALPVGDTGARPVLSTHTGLRSATLFDRLTDVKIGDTFYVDVYGETLAYKVTRIDVITPDQIEALAPTPGKDLVTLMTCTPYAVNSHRLLVTGERVPYDPATDPAPTTLTATTNPVDFILNTVTPLPWYMRLMGVASLGALITGIVMVIPKKKRARSQVNA